MNKGFEKIFERLDELQNVLLSQTEDDINVQVGIINGVMYSKKIVHEVAEECNITNGDKVRSMNDDELAEFLVNFKNTYGDEYEGEISCLDWLKSEADN